MMRRLGLACASLAALAASAAPAHAHIVASRLGDFYAGALHPLTDLQEMILWAALGVLAGSLGERRAKWLVLVFPLGLLVGLGLALAFRVADTGPIAAAAMMVVLGLLMASAIRIPAVVIAVISAGLALLRGAASASGVAPETDPVLFAAGFAAAGYVAITLISAATLAFKGTSADPSRGWRSIAVRACGSWIAAIGLMLGGFALAS